MSYRETDGPFGLLPKKTAMDLEWFGRKLPAPAGKAPPKAPGREPQDSPETEGVRAASAPKAKPAA